jgi:hypothetical protein
VTNSPARLLETGASTVLPPDPDPPTTTTAALLLVGCSAAPTLQRSCSAARALGHSNVSTLKVPSSQWSLLSLIAMFLCLIVPYAAVPNFVFRFCSVI